MTLLPDFRLETHFSKWEFAARHHMTASDAESMTMADLLALASAEDRAAFDALWLGYTETHGAPDLRAAIASTYDARQPDDILCFAGAEEGIYIACHALLSAGDHAIVLTPNYQSAETVPLSICAVTGVPLDPDAGWDLDLDRLAAAIRPNTKLISINFPNNPTGAILTRERFDGLVALCRKHGIWLFSDEVYRGLGPDPDRHLPQAADVYERGVSLNVMSKAYGLPGLRIGWIAAQDRALLAAMERMKHYLSICNSAPSERLALIALKARQTILDRNNARVRTNLDMLEAFLAEHPGLFDWRRPDGGCVAYPRYLGGEGVEAFTHDLVETSGVLLLPASLFRSALGETPADRFRIGYGRANIAACIDALRGHIVRNDRG